ncbi:MAG: carboxypeptidase regulatory-like domain-containing protein [Vicinamibacterales bacterium]
MFTVRVRLAIGVQVVAALAFCSSAAAQTGAVSGLSGRVLDASGGAIAGVTVTIFRPEAGFERSVTTSNRGEWEVRFLQPGVYIVRFERQGFKTIHREGISVTTGQIASVDAVLEVGGLTEVVAVTADARMVSPTSAAIVRTLDAKELEALPTSARNFTQLLAIEPGVSADISEVLSNDNASISPSVNGARTTNNSFVFNGIDVTNMLCCSSRINGSRGTIDAGGGTLSRNMAPAPETLEEVKLQTSLYDASTGRNGGGIFQLVSKSGTNRLSGTSYYYLQDDELLANDFFFERAGTEKPLLSRKEGGFTLGGPVWRNRTFFFGSYQGTRARTSFVDEATNTVLVPQTLTDDRSNAGIDAFAASIWNTSDNGPINLGAINPISRSLLQARLPDGSFMVPSGAGGFNCETRDEQVAASCEVLSIIPATYEQDQFTLNLDQSFGGANRLSGKYFFANQPSRDPLFDGAALTRHEVEETTYQRTLSLTDVHVFGDGIVNELRGGFFRNRNDSMPVSFFTNAEFGIANPFASQVPDLSQITIDGDDVGSEIRFGTPGDGTRIFDRQTTWTVGDTVSLVRGRHSLRFGGELRRHALDGDLQETRNRRHNFDAWFDFLTVGYANPGDRNRARQISDTGLNVGSTVRNYRLTDWSWFVAEDWRVTPNLTLNLGVRHDYYGFPSEKNGFLALYDYEAALVTGRVQDGFLFASNFDQSSIPGAAGLPLNISDRKSIVPGDFDNIAPRASFAWTPHRSASVVVRGGYGLFYERITGAFANSLRQGPPFFRELQLNDAGNWNTIPNDVPTFPVPGFSIGFDDGEPILVGDNDPDTEFEAFETQMVSPDLETPYLHQWNLTTQWEFRPNWLMEIGYVGSKGSRLLQWANLNQALDVDTVGLLARPGVPGGGFTGNYFDVDDDEFVPRDTPPAGCLDEDPGDCVIAAELRGRLLGFDEDEGANFLSNSGRSEYHSMQMSLQRRFNRGYMFNVNYTLSKSMDTYSDEGQFQIEHDQTRPDLNWAVSDFDRRHRLIGSFVWEIPSSGSAWTSGWQVAGVATLQSGRPFTITDEDFSGFLYGSQNPRPSLASGRTLDDQTTSGSVESRVGGYLNRAAFVSSGAQFGTLPRNSVVGAAQRRLDMSVGKTTRFGNGFSIELRLEAYNVTNTPTFRNPENDLGSSNFGQITETRGGPRLVQLGAKLRF